ncbi:hypothetical protein [Leptolyngbya sp. FACHB-711]|nr:hypothetical protein [Leptolyngbya sp. FACHB-711]
MANFVPRSSPASTPLITELHFVYDADSSDRGISPSITVNSP